MGKKTKFSILLFTLVLALVLSFANLATAYADGEIGSAEDTITVTYPYYAFIEDEENPWSSVYEALDATDTIEYSDSFFSEPSPGDHPKLRAASYALALAGFENKKDGYPSETTDTNPKLVNLLNQMGFSDYQFWDENSESDGHSMGTTIGHKTLPSGQELIVVAPRNYNYMTEWLSNFNIGTSGDHAGFSESAGLVLGRFNQYISERSLSNYKVWVVGYSRGGAVIDLFAKNVNSNINNYSMQPDDFYVYTFGAPRASLTETKYDNIHDVKDGNDLLLGYVFPELWGFYNTGVYEEIHPADLEIKTSAVYIADLADSSRAESILSPDAKLTEEVGSMNGKDFMDAWIKFVTENGLTREYFDAEVKEPLSAIMKAYQMRTLDEQSEFTGFIADTSSGMAGMLIGKVLMAFFASGYTSLQDFLDHYAPYQDLVKILRGTASEADVDDFLNYLIDYIGNYDDYEANFGEPPVVSETEFNILKENLPKLIKALSPMLIADAAYTQATYGEDYSLYYTYTLGANAKNLVIGHIPENIMPILKGLIPKDEDDPEEDIVVPDTGYQSEGKVSETLMPEGTSYTTYVIPITMAVILIGSGSIYGFKHSRKWKEDERDYWE